MIKHKKTSGLANTADATLVQPTDWNATHAYALNSIVLLGTVSFGLAGTTVEYEINNDCPYIGTITRLAAGSYTLPIDVATAEGDLLAVEIGSEAQGVVDGPLQGGEGNAEAPVGLFTEETVNERDVEASLVVAYLKRRFCGLHPGSLP